MISSPEGVSLLDTSPPTPGFGPIVPPLLVSESSASDDLMTIMMIGNWDDDNEDPTIHN